jgi:hypothetical protein
MIYNKIFKNVLYIQIMLCVVGMQKKMHTQIKTLEQIDIQTKVESSIPNNAMRWFL